VASDPRVLIDEQPQPQLQLQPQRQRPRRRAIALLVSGLLIVLGFGVSQFTRGGSSPGPEPARPVGGSAQVPTVTYTKTILQKFVPRRRVETQTLETWTASRRPWLSRTVVTIAGGPRFEVGLGPVHDKVFGLEVANYLYDPSTQTRWRIALFRDPPPSHERFFKQTLAASGNRRAGTRMYLGRRVYVVRLPMGTGEQTYYFDKRTFEPLMIDVNSGYDVRTVFRTVVFKILPATKANLALTSLPAAHPRLKTVLDPTQHMRELYVYTT
jgi:hypothetical protein